MARGSRRDQSNVWHASIGYGDRSSSGLGAARSAARYRRHRIDEAPAPTRLTGSAAERRRPRLVAREGLRMNHSSALASPTKSDVDPVKQIDRHQ